MMKTHAYIAIEHVYGTQLQRGQKNRAPLYEGGDPMVYVWSNSLSGIGGPGLRHLQALSTDDNDT